MNSGQHLEQQQRLQQRLSSQQVRYVRLLEMSGSEVAQDLRRELDENAALEVSDEPQTAPNTSADAPAPWLPVVSPASGFTTRGEFIQPQAASESLYEYLDRQIDTLPLSADVARTARYIIGNLDANGYLRRSPASMATDMLLSEDYEPSPQVMEQSLRCVRSLDPAGVGAESLQQCMILQLERMKPSVARDDALRIVQRYFDRLAARRFAQLGVAVGDDSQRLSVALALLRRLNPKPGAPFGVREATNYVEPDFIITVDGGDIRVSLAGNIPELAVSQSFTQAMADMERRRASARDPYVVQRFNDAREYIRILQRRQQTLMDVMTAIVALQKPYFLSGGDDSLLRPMGLKDVAAQTGLDVSVISRATRNKYAQLPWDTVPLRFFFSEAFAQQGATAEVSGRGVEQAIRRIVDAEDKRHPLSDENICRLLAADGFTVSRRTVSKYRDRLQIPVARLRR